MWAQRVIARRGQPAHVLMELPADATAEDAQGAFHKIARTSHPDLHRHGLTPEEIEMVTSAYAAVAGAYQELRTRTMPTTSMRRVVRPDEAAASRGPSATTPPGGMPTTRSSMHTPPGASPIVRPGSTTTPPAAGAAGAPPPGTKAEGGMSSKALTYYRKAEISLRRGDLKGAILQLKLACATDPSSTFLRTALAEVETEVRKST
jgi:hypothetical protein